MRPGKSYTSDTLAALRNMDDQAELYLILGSDMLLDLPKWHRPDVVLQLAQVACVPRRGQAETDRAAGEALVRTFGARICFLPAEAPALSSTEVRDRLEAGLPVEDLLAKGVERYCYESGLYFPPEVRRIQRKLKASLPEKRYRHTMGVVRTAATLAARWGADPGKARLAALLHDCAKYLPEERLRALSGDDTEAVAVWHAFAGAVVAKEEYGVADEDVLRAIRLHATGDADMTLLDETVYLADLIEPGRDFPCVDACRAAVERGPEEGMLFSLLRTEAYVRRTHGVFHPASKRAIAYFTALQKQKPADGAGR